MINLRQLHDLTKNNEKTVNFLLDNKLISDVYLCSKCGNLMTIQKGGKTKIGHRYRCPRPCRQEKCLLKNSFFENCSIEISKMLEFLYYWASEACSYKNMQREIGMSSHAFVAWRSFCRDICIEKVSELDDMIGGEGKEVQIDESAFTKRKYNRGQIYPTQWVFGGIDSSNNDCFMEMVSDRSKNTLVEVIRRRIRPGTTIISDCWASYEGLEIYGYTHKTVNHSRNFVDPVSLVHTQKIESLWFISKRRNKRECGTNRKFLSSYLAEFIWRKRIAGSDPFSKILEGISSLYKFE